MIIALAAAVPVAWRNWPGLSFFHSRLRFPARKPPFEAGSRASAGPGLTTMTSSGTSMFRRRLPSCPKPRHRETPASQGRTRKRVRTYSRTAGTTIQRVRMISGAPGTVIQRVGSFPRVSRTTIRRVGTSSRAAGTTIRRVQMFSRAPGTTTGASCLHPQNRRRTKDFLKDST